MRVCCLFTGGFIYKGDTSFSQKVSYILGEPLLHWRSGQFLLKLKKKKRKKRNKSISVVIGREYASMLPFHRRFVCKGDTSFLQTISYIMGKPLLHRRSGQFLLKTKDKKEKKTGITEDLYTKG